MSVYKTGDYRTVTGNLTKDPDFKFTTNGKAICTIDVAENKDENNAVFWNDIAIWESMAENAAESLHKGDRVVVVFYSKTNKYTNRDGEEIETEKHTAVSLGAELRWATVKITKNPKRK
jgi:single-strand DNA-binding protein